MKRISLWHGRLTQLLVAALAMQCITMTLPQSALAESGAVVGTLVSRDGQPLRNVAVEVRDTNGSTVATGATDKNGKFSITAEAIHAGDTYSICSTAGCGTAVAMTPAAAAVARLSTAQLIAIGANVAGAAGLAIGITVGSEESGSEEATASRSQ
jgi:hypothetical protein